MVAQLDRLVNFVAETEYDDLPEAVVDRTKVVLMDTVGAILGGMSLPEVQALAREASAVGRPPSGVTVGAPKAASVFGWAGKTTPAWAVLVHGTSGTALELDEGHARAGGHPAIHVIPAALALGEAADSSGRETIAAIVLGYEVAARVGMGTRLRAGVHPHGTWGIVGAATAAAKLLGYQPEEIREAINLASNYCLAASFQAAYDGASVRNTYAGVAGQLGLEAAQLVRLGFSGERDGLASVFDRIIGTAFDSAALTDELGQRYMVEEGYFKVHACCRYVHGTLDALLELRRQHPFDPPDVVEVEVDTYKQAAQLSNPYPPSPLGARFSVPHAVSATLIRGTTAPSSFDTEAIADPAIRGLAEKVTVREEPTFTAMTPARRPARVTVHLSDGRTLSHTVHSSRGDRDQPFSQEELRGKYLNLAEVVLGEDRARAALGLIDRLETLEDVGVLADGLRGEGAYPEHRPGPVEGR